MAKSIIPLSDLPVIDKQNDQITNSEIYKRGAAILMDKPIHWSSFDVVRYIRSRIPAKKVGHAGTLDPLATGLLILCSGKATRTVSQIQALPKTYIANIKFGSSTPSYDAETKPDKEVEWTHISEEAFRKAIRNKFTGTISQVPPAYSAIRVKGQRLYKKARRGEDVELYPRQITIHSIEIEDFSLPEITVRVHCGKGTYIRSLAHDLGIELESRAHLTSLRRIDTGHFSVDNALTPEEFDERIKSKKDG
ncbi:MAG: tRNA pseudouridine(55) synthase TruB [Bacteroidetes bacterium]|jgi:tRNA pseudouridine55 synthase|nr:tRNA pseudouridine(55) synthase TruB [Bacteroidota bacterium]